jgi:hypothetical protein
MKAAILLLAFSAATGFALGTSFSWLVLLSQKAAADMPLPKHATAFNLAFLGDAEPLVGVSLFFSRTL